MVYYINMDKKLANMFKNLTIRQETLVGRQNEPKRFVAYEDGCILTWDDNYEGLCRGLEMILCQRRGTKIGSRWD